MSQCQAGETGHGYVNTGAVTSGQDTFTAQACTALPQPGPPTPLRLNRPAPPPPPPLAYTGVAASDFLMTGFGLLIAGTLLLLISRRRTRTGST